MKCPGQDTQYWNQDAIFETQCPKCGHLMEFFKDDAARRCSHCNQKIVNPRMDFGCAAYCRFAEQCLGTLPEEFVAQQEDLLKDRVAVKMKQYFGTDFKRIGHASRVARYAETIGRKEKANLAVVLCASYLHDIGAKNAEKKYGVATARYQQIEGLSVAREILENLGARVELINEVCDIIGGHSRSGAGGTIDSKVVHDANQLAYMVQCLEREELNKETLTEKIQRIYLTGAGRELAAHTLTENNSTK